MKVLDRLKLELNNKPYLNDENYIIILKENKLNPENQYNKEDDEINLLNSIVDIWNILANDITMYMKVETEFINKSDAYKSIEQRISFLENKIDKLSLRKKEDYSHCRLLFNKY